MMFLIINSDFEYYRLSDGETLKDVAQKVYGDPTLDWAIILFNGLTIRYIQHL